ncbi:LAMI_0E03158g1_1 [Lachancea mirantina]|uniref:Peroxisomal membrane protein PEX14 n=1 Tax=Lachancea mirantina TaxID=1230905 RepID=A0A1G4JJS0_9SACH|nr:LAMI_0E03158g1_1 [Lachancea mirantina]
MVSERSNDRQELYESAVAFLRDSSVATAPLSKKVEFLKSKGLTSDEINQVIKDAEKVGNGGGDNASTPAGPTAGTTALETAPYYETMPPPLPARDWRDYFVMATATAGVCYGVYQLAKRYVIPNLVPEPRHKLEQDKQAIMEEFDKVEKLLTTIEQEQEAFKRQEAEKLDELDRTVTDLQTALDATSRTRERIETEFRMLKMEMTTLQGTVDKFISENSGSREFTKLNDEINSLKNLIKNNNVLRLKSPSEKSAVLSPAGQAAVTSIAPGATTVPSASEILAKMNIPKNTDADQPAWKKSREALAIPEWQKQSSQKERTPIPDWQKAMLNAESPSPEEEQAT